MLPEGYTISDNGSFGSYFKQAADQLVQSQAENHWHADGLFIPIAYLYRHAIELELKSLLQTIGECNITKYDNSLLSIH
ncbi:MAG: hypothetical protein D3903_15870 [Candidatus Electrothrix sp. GM3_4]|nr:hypothetical protein [Candidatus Electrothrix sp. GM3_4]